MKFSLNLSKKQNKIMSSGRTIIVGVLIKGIILFLNFL
jgi:hypothetical protein